MVDIGLSSTTIKLMQDPEGSDMELLKEMSLGGNTEHHIRLYQLIILNETLIFRELTSINYILQYSSSIRLSYCKKESDYGTICKYLICFGTVGECPLPV